ncbi:FAD-dependent monooxygenase [Streptosporangium sp. NPDC000239]|uniref:FAD-dependent monooxygenase n=1 Tax=Streptosporangium sp. NPDC000239 TaxID=3154248 RepID=UPI00332824E5
MARAVVIGAGIGGLTAAAALQGRGWDVTVCERAPALEPVGSGLAVAANALRSLDTIGVGDTVRGLSAVRGELGLRRPDGSWLARTTEEEASARYGDSVVLLRRADLVGALHAALAPGTLRLGTTVLAADPGGEVRTEAETLRADLVVAADGVSSPVRATLFPGHPAPRYAGVTSWRVLVPGGGAVQASETWGAGRVFGVMPLAGGLTYCYATDTVPAGTGDGDQRAELLRLFGRWHSPIPGLLAAAEPGDVLRNDVYHLTAPLPAMHRGRIALIGDAAHPMTPNLGQGACQAIEDAVVLAHVVSTGGDLAAYTSARLARTARITARSASICRATRLRGPLAVRLRDTATALTWRFASGRMTAAMDDVLGWRPPHDQG